MTAKPSSTRGTTVAVPDVGPPLQLVRALCDALEEQAVAYCHFKSNNEIARSAAGLNDLDLLVAASEARRFEELVSRLGFKRARPRPSLRVPGVDLANFAGYVLWSLWLVAFAVLLVRRPAPVPAAAPATPVR